MPDDIQLARHAAIAMLARRDYGHYELFSRMVQKGYDEAIVELVTAQLIDEGYLSEPRFAEMMVRSRFARGHGPLWVRRELQTKRVDEQLIDASLEAFDGDWFALAKEVREKRFGAWKGGEFKEKAKQMRFLLGRGFSQEQIENAFD